MQRLAYPELKLLEHFDRVFPNAKVRCLTGDREFVGKEWCSYRLLPKTLPFRLRLRQSDQMSSRSGRSRQSGERGFASLRAGETRILSGRVGVGSTCLRRRYPSER